MGRKPKGKPLTLRPVRLDDDVWAECQRLGKKHGTINEGISTAFAALRIQEAQGRVTAEFRPFPPETPHEPVITRDVSRVPKLNKTRSFKGPILKPKDKK